jgi:hypothetical protein
MGSHLTEDVARRVEGDAELTCLPVANMKRLLHDTLALVGRNVLRLLWVSLKERKGKLTCAPLAPFEFPHFLLSVYVAFVPREHGHTCVACRFDPGMEGSLGCRGRLCRSGA